MSINLIPRNVENTNVVGSAPVVGFAGISATVVANSSAPVDVQQTAPPQIAFTENPHSVNNETRVSATTPQVTFTAQNATVIALPEQNDTNVTASTPQISFTPNNATITVGTVDDFPRLGQLRYGARTYAQDDAVGEAERARIASLHVVYLGMFAGGQWDTGANGWLSRADVILDLKSRNPNLVIYDYIIVMETTDGGTLGNKLDGETGPTGNGGSWTPNDWWVRNTSGARLSSFFNNFNTNISSFVTLDSQGRDYVDFYFEERSASHVNPHAVVGPNGINMFLDNCFYKSRFNSKDLDRDGSRDESRTNPLAHEEVDWRAQTRKLVDLFRSTYPGILVTCNNTDWWDEQSSVIPMQDAYIGMADGGVSEFMTLEVGHGGFPFTRVYSDSSIEPVNFGNWQFAQDSYIYSLENSVGPKHQTYVAAVDIDDVNNVGSGTNFSLYRWTHCSSLLEDGYYHVSDTDGYSNTPQFDEMGTVNEGTTGLSKGWLGQPVDSAARTDFITDGRARRFDNGVVIVNTDLFNSITFPVVDGGDWSNGEIPGGIYEEIAGSQDPVTNQGRIVDEANFPSGYTVNEIDARFFKNATQPDPLFLTLPTWIDERNAYISQGLNVSGAGEVLEDRYSASLRAPFFSQNGINDIHGDTECDDLWVASQMQKRLLTSQPSTASLWNTRKNNFSSYFRDDWFNSSEWNGDELFLHDHLYGWGLCEYAQDTGDAAAINTINSVVADLINWNATNFVRSPGDGIMPFPSSGRIWGRQLIFAVAAQDASPTTNNKFWRDRVIDLVLQASDWNETYNFYAATDLGQTDGILGGGSFSSGDRIILGFGSGLIMDGLWRAWRSLTDEGDTRALSCAQRLVDMASHFRDLPLDGNGFIQLYTGHNISSGAGINAGGAGNPSGVYSICPVNGLVMAYKFTGDADYLTRAWDVFKNWQSASSFSNPGPTGSGTVHHYVDSQISSGTGYQYLDNNKSELQYTYALFEGGGNYQQVSGWQPAGVLSALSSTMASDTWSQVTTTTGLQSVFTNYINNISNSNRSPLEYSVEMKWHANDAEVHFLGGGHPGSSSQTHHFIYTDSTGNWTDNADANNNGHAYSHFAMNKATKECYGRNNGSNAVRYWPGSGSSQWGSVAGFASGQHTIADALEWWPAANGGNGGLLHYTRWGQQGRIHLSNSSVTSWDNGFAGGFDDVGGGDIHVAAVWLPNQEVMMVGGGNGQRSFIQINTNGTTQDRADTPAHWGPAFETSNGSIVSFENGRVFYIGLGINQLWEYDYNSDNWSFVINLPFVSGSNNFSGSYWHATCAIDSIDAIYLIGHTNTSTSSVHEWLYKI